MNQLNRNHHFHYYHLKFRYNDDIVDLKWFLSKCFFFLSFFVQFIQWYHPFLLWYFLFFFSFQFICDLYVSDRRRRQQQQRWRWTERFYLTMENKNESNAAEFVCFWPKEFLFFCDSFIILFCCWFLLLLWRRRNKSMLFVFIFIFGFFFPSLFLDHSHTVDGGVVVGLDNDYNIHPQNDRPKMKKWFQIQSIWLECIDILYEETNNHHSIMKKKHSNSSIFNWFNSFVYLIWNNVF